MFWLFIFLHCLLGHFTLQNLETSLAEAARKLPAFVLCSNKTYVVMTDTKAIALSDTASLQSLL